MSNNTFIFNIKVGDVINLNETIDGCADKAKVVNVFYDDGYADSGIVTCNCEGWDGEINFSVDGSTWDQHGNFKREITPGWDASAPRDPRIDAENSLARAMVAYHVDDLAQHVESAACFLEECSNHRSLTEAERNIINVSRSIRESKQALYDMIESYMQPS